MLSLIKYTGITVRLKWDLKNSPCKNVFIVFFICFFVSKCNDLSTLNQSNVSLLQWGRMNYTLLVEYTIFAVEPGRNLVQRGERVNQGEGASTGAYSINPPQELTTRTARESVSRALIRCDSFPTTGLFWDSRPPAASFQWAQDQRHDGWVLFLKWTQLSCEVVTWEDSFSSTWTPFFSWDSLQSRRMKPRVAQDVDRTSRAYDGWSGRKENGGVRLAMWRGHRGATGQQVSWAWRAQQERNVLMLRAGSTPHHSAGYAVLNKRSVHQYKLSLKEDTC